MSGIVIAFSHVFRFRPIEWWSYGAQAFGANEPGAMALEVDIAMGHPPSHQGAINGSPGK